MKLAETSKIRAVPIQFIETSSGVILKRGCCEFKVSGEKATAVLHHILRLTAGRGASIEEICNQYALPNRPAVHDLIDQLVAKRILVPAEEAQPLNGPETSLDIFYWHFGESTQKITTRLNRTHIAVLGVNTITRRLAASLSASGITNADVIDFPLLRNLRFYDENGLLDVSQWELGLPLEYEAWLDKFDGQSPNCIVAATDFGAHEVLREWNNFCVKKNLHYLPVVLQNLIGFVGPLVVPGETPCFECLRARQNSHFSDVETERAAEQRSFESQPFIGAHPTMASILGDLAAFELIRFYSDVLPRQNMGRLIEVNLLATYMKARKVLKVPRCSVCSVLNKTASIELVNHTPLTTRQS